MLEIKDLDEYVSFNKAIQRIEKNIKHIVTIQKTTISSSQAEVVNFKLVTKDKLESTARLVQVLQLYIDQLPKLIGGKSC